MANRNDLNINSELNADLMAGNASPAFKAVSSGNAPVVTGARTSQQQSDIEDALRRLNDFEASLSGLPDDIKLGALQQIDALRGMIAGGNMPLGGVSNLMADLRNSVAAAEKTASTNGAAARDEAIGSRSYPLSAAGAARVRERMDALRNNDVDAWVRSYSSDLNYMAPEDRDAVVNARLKIANSEEGRAQFKQTQQAIQEDPKSYESAERRVESQKERLLEDLRRERDPKRQHQMQFLLSTGLYAKPGMHDALDAFHKGAPVNEVNTLMAPVVERYTERMSGRMDEMRQYTPHYVKELIAGAPSHQQAALSQDTPEGNRLLAERMTEVLKSVGPNDYAMAKNSLRLRGPEGLTPREREVIAATNLAESLKLTTIQEGVLEYYADIRQQLGRGEAIAGHTQETLAFIDNASHGYRERAERMIDGVTTHGEKGFGNNTIRSNRESSVAMAALTLAFTDKNGGIAKYYQHAALLNAGNRDATPEQRADAKAYMQQYQQFMATSLLGPGADATNPSHAAMLPSAMRRAGTDMLSGELTLKTGPDGAMQMLDRYGQSRGTSFYQADSYLAQHANYEQINNVMYEEAMRSGNWQDAGNVARVHIDTYRLYDTEQGRLLIDQMSRGEISNEQAYEQASYLSSKVQQRMDAFAPSVVRGLESQYANDPQHLDFLRQRGVIGADGALNIDMVMDGAMTARRDFRHDYEQYKNLSLEQLQALPDRGAERYEARLVYGIASRLYASQAFDNVELLGDSLRKQQAELERSGAAANPQFARDLELYNTLTDTSERITPPMRREALKQLLERDDYLAGRPELLQSAVEVIMDHLAEDPDHLAHRDQEVAASHTSKHAETTKAPVVGSEAATPSAETRAPAAHHVYDPSLPQDAREKEGSAGAFDNAHKTDLEKAVLGVLQGMSTQVRLETFGQAVDKFNVGERSFISYNEIERALKAAGFSRPQDIGNGDHVLSAEEILAALTPNLAQNGPAQGKA